MSLLGRPPDQVGLVVADLDGAAASLARGLGYRRWVGWLYDGAYMPLRRYRGRPGDFVSRTATAGSGPQVSLIEPVAGASIFAESLSRQGPGMHHLGYLVEDYDAARAELVAAGYDEIQAGGGHGLDGDGRLGFFELDAVVPIRVEIIEPPRRRAAPHFTIDVGT